MTKVFKRIMAPGLVLLAVACLPPNMPKPGPDKQFLGTVSGAATGAGSGAIIGAQVSAGTGPGAFIGAGFGAVFGMLNGLGIDLLEEDQIRREILTEDLARRAYAQQRLQDHYRRRLALYPSRDIFPADWFFEADETKLSEKSSALTEELALLMKSRMPWSRLVVVAYTTSSGDDNTYADFLSERRAKAIANGLVRGGLEPRRVSAAAVILPEPLLVDPSDVPWRYKQAIELVALDY